MKRLLVLLLLFPSLPLRAQTSAIIVNNAVTCATSNDGSVVGILNPQVSTTTSPVYSGTLAAGTYYIEYSWYDWLGRETLVSPEQTQQLTSAGSIVVNPPAGGVPASAAGMRVYMATASGAETLQGQTSGAASFTQSTPLTAGVIPLAVNSTQCRGVASDALWPSGTGYNVGISDAMGNPYPGSPMVWQLMGPGTTINLGLGLPYYHGVTFFPTPLLASPTNHATQSISGSLSLGVYTLYAAKVVSSNYSSGGAAGYSGVKTMGSCTVTITNGLITSISGC